MVQSTFCILWIINHNPRTINILLTRRNIQVVLQEHSKSFFTSKCRSIISTNTKRFRLTSILIIICRNSLILNIFLSSPSSSTISINYLTLSIILVSKYSILNRESSLEELFNTIISLWVRFQDKCRISHLNFITIIILHNTIILWVFSNLSTIKITKFFLSRIKCYYLTSCNTNILLKLSSFSSLLNLTKTHQTNCTIHFFYSI